MRGTGKDFCQAWNVLDSLRLDFVEHAHIDPDVGDADAAAMLPSRQQKMRGLAAEERHRLHGVNRNPHDGAGRAVDPARQVDGENGGAVGVDSLDHLERLALDGAIETGAEQRIDDQRRLADRLRIERQHRKFPAARRQRGIAPQAVPFAEQDHRDLAAAGGQFGRRDKTVTAIVAAAGDHHDGPLPDELHGGFGHGLARAHHQRETGRAGGDRQPVRTLHFGGGQHFHAESSIQSPFSQALRVLRASNCTPFAYQLIGLPIRQASVSYPVRFDLCGLPVKSLITFRNQAR